ncbi:MAG: hypothetical protein WBN09_02070 [Woeseiaceae bacterium]
MMWYSSNIGAFVMGWVVQMIAMLTLSGVFAAAAWQTRKSHPLSTFVAGIALLIASASCCSFQSLAWQFISGRNREPTQSRGTNHGLLFIIEESAFCRRRQIDDIINEVRICGPDVYPYRFEKNA